MGRCGLRRDGGAKAKSCRSLLRCLGTGLGPEAHNVCLLGVVGVFFGVLLLGGFAHRGQALGALLLRASAARVVSGEAGTVSAPQGAGGFEEVRALKQKCDVHCGASLQCRHCRSRMVLF